jgi:hypothetical protein
VTLPWFDGANYTLCRESEEFVRCFREEDGGRVTAGWELKVPDRGDDGVPFQFIFVGPTAEHRGAGLRLALVDAAGGALSPETIVTVEARYKTGAERMVFLESAYGRFDDGGEPPTVTLDRRAEAGEDWLVRVAASVPAGTPEPDPEAAESFFELDCVKLWWNETA